MWDFISSDGGGADVDPIRLLVDATPEARAKAALVHSLGRWGARLEDGAVRWDGRLEDHYLGRRIDHSLRLLVRLNNLAIDRQHLVAHAKAGLCGD